MTIITSPKQLKAEAKELAARFAGKPCELNGQKAQIFRAGMKGKLIHKAIIRTENGREEVLIGWYRVKKVFEVDNGAFCDRNVSYVEKIR